MVRKILLSFIVIVSVVSTALSQNRQISGVVIDDSGLPIVGATVLVENTNIGATTDIDGKFAFSAPTGGTISVSYLGYLTVSEVIGLNSTYKFTLLENSQVLDDVVVVAFGTAKKEAFTGSAKVIESEDISKIQTSNIATALVGRVAGVQTSDSSGSLGSTPDIRVRGFGSIGAGQTPLWIVDGVPFSGDLNNINTSDIESMTVLKDAASNALYGSRGANGVIMITTKKASRGEAVITVDVKMGVNSKALQSYDVITDPGEYYQTHYKALYNEAYDRLGTTGLAHTYALSKLTGNGSGGLGYNIYSVPAGEALIGASGQLNPNATLGNVVTGADGSEYLLTSDNWMDEAYETSTRKEYNVSVSASNEQSSFYGSIGYLDNDGIIQGSSLDRFTGRLRADYQAKKWLKVGGNMSYTHFGATNGNSSEGESNATTNIFAVASQVAPIYPVYIRDASGNIVTDSNGYQMYDYGNGLITGSTRSLFINSNALQTSWLDTSQSSGNAFSANGFADFQILPNLKFTINASSTVDETRFTTMYNDLYGSFASTGGSLTKSHYRTLDSNTQQLLSYNKSFGEHNFDLLLGHEYTFSETVYLTASKSVLFSLSNLELSGAVVDSQVADSSAGIYNTEGYFSRLQWDLHSKYFASASYRRDASSNFHPDHRWGNFWSVGGAWIVSKEDFMYSSVGWLDMLKYKISYGSQGNDAIGSYLYTDTYTLSNSDNNIAVVFNTKGNENITWETNANFNTGVEFSLFKGRIGGSIDAFNRKTTDMLFAFSVPASLGYTYYYDNVGDMVNRGVEGELYGDIIRRPNFVWSGSINATYVSNKVLYLADEKKTLNIEGYEGYVSGDKYIAEGLPLYTYYIREFAGVDDQTGEALFYVNTTDADGNVTGRETTTDYNNADQYLLGTAMPNIYGGFSTSIAAYGFDLSVSFTYQIGGQVYDSGYQAFLSSPTVDTAGTNYHKDILDAWTPENPTSDIPRLYYGDQTSTYISSQFLTDASYLNISNINFGYTLPQTVTRQFGVTSFRVYLACDNVTYWSQRQGLDPRYSFSGETNYSNYSPIRTISGGINVVF